MIARPDRARFWRSWRRRWPRLVVVFAGAVMATLLLAAIDWTPLETFHLGWLFTIAEVLLWVLWLGLLFTMAALAFLAVALRVDRVVVDGGGVRRHLVFGRTMEVPKEGATRTRGKRADVIANGTRRLVVPHVFYGPEELDRFWESAGLGDSAAS